MYGVRMLSIIVIHFLNDPLQPEDFVIATGEMHSVREFVVAAFRHVGKEIEWEGEAETEVGKEKGTDIVRVRVNPKYYRPTEVEQLQVKILTAKLQITRISKLYLF